MFPLHAVFGAVTTGFFTAAQSVYWTNIARDYASHVSGRSNFALGQPPKSDYD